VEKAERARMAEHKQAVVVGALGVIGRYIVARLLEQGDWSVVGRRCRAALPPHRCRSPRR
jgi:NAD(P)-dependent dehydrogenase (short-subunit alcohol dehydrogenase family)